MRVRDLGPLRIVTDGIERACSGTRQAAILSLLATKANTRVSSEELTIAGWGYDNDVSASTIENHIWRLRRLLEPGRGRGVSSVLVTEQGGYRLIATDDALDSLRFEAAVARSREALDAGEPAEALRCCDEALALWRGDPYAAVGHVGAVAAAVGRLMELHGQAQENRIEALLASGRAPVALADLEALTQSAPFRERLWAMRMRALATQGRNEEALSTYQQIRTLLGDELGLDPGPELRELHAAIVSAQGPSSPAAAVTASAPPATPAAAVRLPGRPSPLIGRERELSQLPRLLAERPIVTLVGPGGSGKTRLAVELARRAAARYPDGVWFVDLTEVTRPELVADAVVSVLGIAADEQAGRAAEGAAQDAGRSAAVVEGAIEGFVRERRLLLLLDNCEHVLDGVVGVAEAVAGSSPGSTVLATSREPLALDTEAVWSLPPLSLEPSEDEGNSAAVELFLARMPAARSEGLDDESLQTIAEICARVDALPLAIELAAARTGAFTLAEIAEQVSADPSALSRVRRGAPDHRSTLWSTIDWSYRLLDPAERRAHSRLAVLPGPFTLPVATAVVQSEFLGVSDVPGILAGLVHRSLLVPSPPARRGRPSTFRQLETVRAHAARRLAEEGGATDAAARRDDWVRRLLSSRPRLGDPAGAAWYDELDESYPIVRAALHGAAIGAADRALVRLGAALPYFWYYRGRVIEGRRWLETAAAALRDDDESESVMVRLGLAATAFLSGRVELAQEQLARALPRVAALDPEDLVEVGEALVAAGNSAWARNEYESARRIAAALSDLAAGSGDSRLLLLADEIACVAGLTSRPPQETGRLAERVYERAVASGDLLAQWTACGARMIVSALVGEPEAGIAWVDRLIPAHVHFGTGGGGAFLEALANFASLAGDAELAVRMHGAAWAEIRRVGMVWPIQLGTLELLERARGALDPGRYELLWDEGRLLGYEDVARARGLVADAAAPGSPVR